MRLKIRWVAQISFTFFDDYIFVIACRCISVRTVLLPLRQLPADQQVTKLFSIISNNT